MYSNVTLACLNSARIRQLTLESKRQQKSLAIRNRGNCDILVEAWATCAWAKNKDTVDVGYSDDHGPRTKSSHKAICLQY